MLDTAAKDLKRLRHIVGTVMKYGYGSVIGKAPELSAAATEVTTVPAQTANAPAPRRFRMMLEELGPTFIKLGQVLSSRPDLVSAAYIKELKFLQAECTPLSYDEISQAIMLGLGRPPEELFRSLEPVSIATASVAQVHRAVTLEGAQVVVKVQRPGIREEIRADIDILYRFGQLLEAVIEESAITDPVAVVREFEHAIQGELDFMKEAGNLREFRRTHQGREDIVVPMVHEALSSATVLTLDFLDGTPFSHLPAEVDKKKIAERILREGFDEIFLDGFFHGDPHPGNILLLKDGRYGILDFGLCGRLTPQMRETLVVLSLAVALKDADTAARTLYRLGQSDARVSISELRDDLTGLFHRYVGQKIQDVDATLVLQELMLLAMKHKIRVPAEYTMLGRAGATIEGIIREFDPEIDVAKVAGPYAEQLLMGRVGPDQLQGGIYRLLLQMQGMSQDLPLQMSQILSDLAAGNFSTNVRGASLDRITSTLLVAATAISLSILGGAFVIGAFIALSQVQWNIYGVPVIAVMAAVAGGTIFSWVSAYLLLRPRMRKLRLRDFIGRGKAH